MISSRFLYLHACITGLFSYCISLFGYLFSICDMICISSISSSVQNALEIVFNLSLYIFTLLYRWVTTEALNNVQVQFRNQESHLKYRNVVWNWHALCKEENYWNAIEEMQAQEKCHCQIKGENQSNSRVYIHIYIFYCHPLWLHRGQ